MRSHVKSYLGQFIHFLPGDDALIAEAIVIKKFDKKQQVTGLGEVEDCIYLVVSGLLRKYFFRGEEEVITHLVPEGMLLTSGSSFFKQLPSLYIVEALEPTTAISYSNYEKLFSTDHRWEKAGRELIQEAMLRKEFWMLDSVLYTPRERFLHFMRSYPELLQRVPQKYLASFLDIQPETFSRLKHLLHQE